MYQPESSQQVERTECVNPGNGEIIGYSDIHTPEEVKGFIECARKIQPEWAALPMKAKITYMKKIKRYMVDNVDSLAESVARDNGKTRFDALATEILPAVSALTYYCKKAKSFLKDRYVMPGSLLFINKVSKITRMPYGVVGVISPWNYPFSIPFSEVVMALLAGNCVVLKAATETQMAGLALKKCMDAAGLPEGVFTYVNMRGSAASKTLLENNIDKLFFTGSVGVGKQLSELAAKTLTPVCLELGGNDAMLVCEDADLYRAAAGAVWAGYQNAGQSCGGVERIYVHENVYGTFLSILKDKTESLRVGYDTDHQTDIGCMTTLRQVETVKRHVDDALEKGAVVYARAKLPVNVDNPYVVAPMVLTNVDHSMLVMNDETFGPVVGMMKVKSMEEAVELANDSSLGLTCSVWSKNRKYAESLAKRIKVGVATINDHLMSHGLAETPWGGPKETGGGRTHGALGFEEMTFPKVVVHDLYAIVAHKNLWWHPFSKGLYNGIKGACYFFYGNSISQRISGIFSLMKILPRMLQR
jgi:succinate-semialdehyde dehydrogenase/glutarate-semialdehyde dehydrogenase